MYDLPSLYVYFAILQSFDWWQILHLLCLAEYHETCMAGQYYNRPCMYKVNIELLTVEDKKISFSWYRVNL